MFSRTYTLLGDPIPLARPRRGFNKLFDAQKQIKFSVGLQLRQQHPDDLQFQGPLSLDAVFYFSPASAWTKKKTHENLGSYHHTIPDLDNCIKFLCDVSQGIIFQNDCTIAQITAKKIYDEQARVIFTIASLKK